MITAVQLITVHVTYFCLKIICGFIVNVEKKKREAAQAATAVSHALVDHLNTGYFHVCSVLCIDVFVSFSKLNICKVLVLIGHVQCEMKTLVN